MQLDSLAVRRPVRGARRQAGFTIIELMIVVAIIGLLAGIGIPSYRDSVAKGKRSEGKAALLAAAARLERYYTQYNCYPSAACGPSPFSTNSSDALKNAGIPYDTATGFGFSGDTYAKAAYAIVVLTPLNSQQFTLVATPKAPWTDAKCGSLAYTNTGKKSTQAVVGSDDSPVKDGCW